MVSPFRQGEHAGHSTRQSAAFRPAALLVTAAFLALARLGLGLWTADLAIDQGQDPGLRVGSGVTLAPVALLKLALLLEHVGRCTTGPRFGFLWRAVR